MDACNCRFQYLQHLQVACHDAYSFRCAPFGNGLCRLGCCATSHCIIAQVLERREAERLVIVMGREGMLPRSVTVGMTPGVFSVFLLLLNQHATSSHFLYHDLESV